MSNAFQITSELCRQRVMNVLRDYIGAGKQYTVESASDAVGCDKRTLRSYLDGENLPPLPTFLRMCAVFGPGFANRLLHMASLDGCYRQDVQPVTDLELNAEACAMVGDLGRALRTGRIDHRARPEILHDARILKAALDDWIAVADGAAVDEVGDLPQAMREFH